MSEGTPVEIEAKLQAPNHLALHQIPAALEAEGLYVTDPGLIYVTDHYLDTADLHLKAAGWALRLRDVGTRRILTLKALRPAEDGVSQREEVEETVADEVGTDWEFGAGALGGRLAELTGGAALRRLFVVEQTRNVYTVISNEGLQLEVSTDSVRWQGENAEEEGWFAELELKKGRAEQLRHLALRLGEALSWKSASESKYERGLRVAGLVPRG